MLTSLKIDELSAMKERQAGALGAALWIVTPERERTAELNGEAPKAVVEPPETTPLMLQA